MTYIYFVLSFHGDEKALCLCFQNSVKSLSIERSRLYLSVYGTDATSFHIQCRSFASIFLVTFRGYREFFLNVMLWFTPSKFGLWLLVSTLGRSLFFPFISIICVYPLDSSVWLIRTSYSVFFLLYIVLVDSLIEVHLNQ